MCIYDEKFSVVIPAYNEGELIYENLLKMSEMFAMFCSNYEMIVVNDGSKDNTDAEIRRAAGVDEHIIPAGYVDNRGKGGAIREGIEQASGVYIGLLDADMDLSPMHFQAFLKKMKETNATAVIGSKLHKDSKVEYPFFRRLMSYGYYILVKILFQLNVKDTQTGVKLFNARALKQIIGCVKAKGFAYDIEILALIKQAGGNIEEMPIELNFQRGSRWGRIKIGDIVKVAKETFAAAARMKKVRKMGIWCEEAV